MDREVIEDLPESERDVSICIMGGSIPLSGG